MQTKYGFTKIDADEFAGWIGAQSISRTCVRVQQHHTWKPRYSNFSGSNHFELQKNMRNHHVNTNGWSDIGQHFSIFPDGVIVTGRPLNKSPACIYGANSDALCIENVGNFDQDGDTITTAQSDSIFSTTAALLKKIGISTPTKTNVVYHHWYDSNGGLVYHNSGQKSCPGTAFFGGNQLADFESNFLPRLKSEMSGLSAPLPVGLSHWAMVTANSLNVRDRASSSATLSNTQGPLEVGSVVRVYEVSENGWFRISQSAQLWVYGRYTEQVAPATVNTDDTNARIGPGMQHDIARVFQPGDRVFTRGQDGEWFLTTEGLYIHGSLLG